MLPIETPSGVNEEADDIPLSQITTAATMSNSQLVERSQSVMSSIMEENKNKNKSKYYQMMNDCDKTCSQENSTPQESLTLAEQENVTPTAPQESITPGEEQVPQEVQQVAQEQVLEQVTQTQVINEQVVPHQQENTI